MADKERSLQTASGLEVHPAIRSAARLWAESSTGQSLARRNDLINDKAKTIESFFADIRKTPAEVNTADVRRWREGLEEKGLTPSTVYTRTCFLSSFYRWAMTNTPLGERLGGNPVTLARPKKPKPYRTDRTKSLLDDELRALVSFVKARAADAGSVVEKRDYALLQWYVKTGRRRSEVISLRGSDVQVREVARGSAREDVLIVRYRIKGGRYLTCELRDPIVRAALLDYANQE